jgi:hypothetical protein
LNVLFGGGRHEDSERKIADLYRFRRNAGDHRIAGLKMCALDAIRARIESRFFRVFRRACIFPAPAGLAEAACDHWIVACEMRQKRKTRREISGRVASGAISKMTLVCKTSVPLSRLSDPIEE